MWLFQIMVLPTSSKFLKLLEELFFYETSSRLLRLWINFLSKPRYVFTTIEKGRIALNHKLLSDIKEQPSGPSEVAVTVSKKSLVTWSPSNLSNMWTYKRHYKIQIADGDDISNHFDLESCPLLCHRCHNATKWCFLTT